MPDKKNNLEQDDKKQNPNRQPNQVAEPDKHVGATADEDIPQDDPKLGGKGKSKGDGSGRKSHDS